MYAGAFGWADDVVLLAPSLERNGVNLRNICYRISCNYYLIPSKSKLMYFNVSHENLSDKLCGKEVLLVSHETYLGNFIGSDVFDRGLFRTITQYVL